MSTAKTKESGSSVCLALLLSILCLPASVIWSAYVMTVLWGWFVTPTYGLPCPGLVPVAGLTLLLHMLCGGTRFRKPDEYDSHLERTGALMAWSAFTPAFFLLVGYVLTKFMPQ